MGDIYSFGILLILFVLSLGIIRGLERLMEK
jgi:hypothetical protein